MPPSEACLAPSRHAAKAEAPGLQHRKVQRLEAGGAGAPNVVKLGIAAAAGVLLFTPPGSSLESLTGETCSRQVKFLCCIKGVKDSYERGAGERGRETRRHSMNRTLEGERLVPRQSVLECSRFPFRARFCRSSDVRLREAL